MESIKSIDNDIFETFDDGVSIELSESDIFNPLEDVSPNDLDILDDLIATELGRSDDDCALDFDMSIFESCKDKGLESKTTNSLHALASYMGGNLESGAKQKEQLPVFNRKDADELLVMFKESPPRRDHTRQNNRECDVFLVNVGDNTFDIPAWTSYDLDYLRKDKLLAMVDLVRGCLNKTENPSGSIEEMREKIFGPHPNYEKYTNAELRKLLSSVTLSDYLKAVFQSTSVRFKPIEATGAVCKLDRGKQPSEWEDTLKNQETSVKRAEFVIRQLVENFAPKAIDENFEELMDKLEVRDGFILKWLYENPPGTHKLPENVRFMYERMLGVYAIGDDKEFEACAMDHLHLMVCKTLLDRVEDKYEFLFSNPERGITLCNFRTLKLGEYIGEMSEILMPVAKAKAAAYQSDGYRDEYMDFVYSDKILCKACCALLDNKNPAILRQLNLQHLRTTMMSSADKILTATMAHAVLER